MAYSDDSSGGVFGVDVSGWVEQHRSRDVYEVVREPVQNALDTGSDLYVRVDYGDQSVTVEDYGDGVVLLGQQPKPKRDLSRTSQTDSDPVRAGKS